MIHRHEIPLRVTEAGYEPTEDIGRAQHAKMKVGAVVGGRIARSRSITQHRLYWKVIQTVTEATGRWATPEALHLALKLATGHIEVVQLLNGRLVKVPESTAFNAMNQTEFQAYCTQAFRIICDEIMGGMSIDELLTESGLSASEAGPYTTAEVDQAMQDDARYLDDVLQGHVGAKTDWGG
jgi:hypothetical protein